jgi:hypothetical protein
MNIGSYLRFGNMLTGAYNADQKDIANRQRQQQIDNLLATSALARQIDSQNFRDQQTALGGLGAFYRNLTSDPPPPETIAPAPTPGQNSARQPLPPVDTAQSFPVPPRSIQTVQLPGAESVPTFGPKQQFDHISTPEQVAAAVDAKKMSPNAAASILLDMARRGVGQTPAPAASPAMPPAQQGQDADSPLSPGTYGRTMALIQNNQPLNLAARTAADLLKAHPNMSNRELALTMSMVNPVITKQADAALRDARLSDTDFFKTVNALLQQDRNRRADALLPSQIDKNESQAAKNAATAGYYSGGSGAGGGAAPQATDAGYDLALAYLNGKLGATGGPTGAARQKQAFDQLKEIGLRPSDEKPYQNDLAAARSAQTQLTQRATTLQATAEAIDTQLSQAVALAKQLNLDGPVTWNSGKLYVGNKAIPTDSPIYEAIQKYDTLVKDASREAGAQQMFGRATVAGLRLAEKVVDANKGAGLAGVVQGLKAGAQASVEAINHTIAATRVMPELRLISRASKPEVAAQALGFTPISMDKLKEYAKQHKITEDQAAMALSTQPNHPYYVVGYPYGQ